MSTSSDDFPGSFGDVLLEAPQTHGAISSDFFAAPVSTQYGSIKTGFQKVLSHSQRLSDDDASTLDDMFLRMRLWESTIEGSAGSISDFELRFPSEADTVRMHMGNILLALGDVQLFIESEGNEMEEPDRPVNALKAAIQDLSALSESLQTLIGLRNGSGPEARVKRAMARRRDASLLKPIESSLSVPAVTPVIGNSLDPGLLPEPAPFAGLLPASDVSLAEGQKEARNSWGSLVPLDPRYGSEPIVLERATSKPSASKTRPPAKTDSTTSKGRSAGYLIGRHPECDIVVKETIVSNRHCLLFFEESAAGTVAIVEDLSTNGTYVNEALIGRNQRRELEDNDEISLHGKARYVFKYPPSRQNSPFLRTYNLMQKIGKGHFAEVYACIEKATGQRWAVKVFINHGSEGELSRTTRDSIRQESGILMSVSHPNILCIKDIFNERDRVYLILEYAPAGELFNYIIMKQKLSESEARSLFQQLFEGMKYLHERNIIHRDIKPENIFLMDNNGRVKLADFGLSKIVGEASFTTTLCGTPSYVAPEVLTESKNRKYTKAVDIWSLGVVLYICLCGFPPFSDELYTRDFPYTLSQQIKAGRFDYPSPYWDSVADPALDLIDSMLVVDPERRFTIEQCMEHPWMTQLVPGVNDSTGGLVGGMAGLEVTRRGLFRERTLLADLTNEISQRAAVPVAVGKSKGLNKASGSQQVSASKKDLKEPSYIPSTGDKRLFGGHSDKALFGDDGDDGDEPLFGEGSSQARNKKRATGKD